jgi:hypothetical protein
VRILDKEDNEAMNQKPDSDSSFPVGTRLWVDKGIDNLLPNIIAEREDTCAGDLVFLRSAPHAEIVQSPANSS